MRLLTWLYRHLERETCDRCRRRGSIAQMGPFVLSLNETATGLAPICWDCHIRAQMPLTLRVRQVRGENRWLESVPEPAA